MSFSFLLRRDGVNPVDYRIRDGVIVLSFGADAVRDRLYVALTTQLGEWFLDVTDGVPYYGENGILGGKKSEAEVAAIIRRRILLDPDVDRIESFTLQQDARRHVSIECRVKLSSGESVTVEV